VAIELSAEIIAWPGVGNPATRRTFDTVFADDEEHVEGKLTFRASSAGPWQRVRLGLHLGFSSGWLRSPSRLDVSYDMQKFSLEALSHELLERAVAAGGGHTASTVVGGHERVLRQTVIAMVEGAILAEHENPGEATVHVLRGRVRLSAGEQSWDGRSGDLLVVPDARHSLEALETSAVLLTVAKLP
jgi:quercetin dioxygenase-like cupin family protein